MFNGKIHYKWLFSIAMLNYRRVEFNHFSVIPSYSPSFHMSSKALKMSTMIMIICWGPMIFFGGWDHYEKPTF